MSKELAVPDYLKAMMDEGSVQDQTQSMNVAVGGVPRLTTRGSVFRFKNGEDEEQAGREVDVVIVGMSPEHGLAHTYYKDAYNPNSNDPPDCSSMNGVTPDPWINSPQNDVCASCPNQVWGSAKSMSGGKAKACRDSKHLYVARASEFAKNPDECTLYLMQVTVNSLKDFSKYGKELAAAGFPGPQFVLTRLTFDEESSVPKVFFEIMGPLNEKLGRVSWTRSQSKEWDTPTPEISHDNKHALPPGQVDEEIPMAESESKANLEEADVSDLIENW